MERESKSWILTVGKVITGIVYAILVVYIVILTLAFFLRLFGANPSADFAEWVYTAASRIMEPFRGIFPTTPIGDARGVRRVAPLRHHRLFDRGAGLALADRLVHRPAHGAQVPGGPRSKYRAGRAGTRRSVRAGRPDPDNQRPSSRHSRPAASRLTSGTDPLASVDLSGEP